MVLESPKIYCFTSIKYLTKTFIFSSFLVLKFFFYLFEVLTLKIGSFRPFVSRDSNAWLDCCSTPSWTCMYKLRLHVSLSLTIPTRMDLERIYGHLHICRSNILLRDDWELSNYVVANNVPDAFVTNVRDSEKEFHRSTTFSIQILFVLEKEEKVLFLSEKFYYNRYIENETYDCIFRNVRNSGWNRMKEQRKSRRYISIKSRNVVWRKNRKVKVR